MLLLKIFIICLISLNANAKIYGLSSANPITKEERNQKSLFLNKHMINYPKEMRNNIIMLSKYGKKNNPNFQVIVHEGQDLLTISSYEEGVDGFLNAIKGLDDKSFLQKKQKSPKFSTKYNQSIDGVIKNEVFFKNGKTKFIKDSNIDMIEEFSDVKNYWLNIDDKKYSSKQHKIQDIINSNYDVVIINPIFNNKTPYTTDEISLMKFKKNGAKRLLLAETNLAEINPNDYRFKKNWKIGKPKWLVRDSLVSQDTIITQYWTDEWKKLLSRHFKAIVETGYSGAFLTGADNHKYFQEINPVD